MNTPAGFRALRILVVSVGLAAVSLTGAVAAGWIPLPLPVAYLLGLWPRSGTFSFGEIQFDVNVDEAAVPAYELPPVLVGADGSPVADPLGWPRRRGEIVDLFSAHVYGRTPAVDEAVAVSREESAEAPQLPGARRLQARVHLLGGGVPWLEVLAYLPPHSEAASRARPVPAFVAFNFRGNHTVAHDAGIRLAESPVPADGIGGGLRAAGDADRGRAVSRWPVEEILARGYAVVTAYPGDFAPDDPDRARDGLLGELGSNRSAGAEWGTLGAWAFGLSRIVDWIERVPELDGDRVAVMGHSRMGKAALWAGAQDERFGIVISNDSGCGGAALSRRRFGESVAAIQALFPHWFSPAFKRYARNEAALPVDQHLLLAAIAPRALYVASAAEDAWADPRGEFEALVAAQPAFALHGATALDEALPRPGESLRTDRVGYHLRDGDHDLTAEDWAHFLDFADDVWETEPSDTPATNRG